MELFKLVKTFKNDESGAVTVDWVVLTAAIVGLGIAVLTAVAGSVSDVTDAIGADLSQSTGFDTRVTDAFNGTGGGGDTGGGEETQ